MRLSGSEIRDAIVGVLTWLGIDVFDAGLTGTEMQYFIAGTKPYDLVFMISASHNPPQYNGLKIVVKGVVIRSVDRNPDVAGFPCLKMIITNQIAMGIAHPNASVIPAAPQ